MAKLLNEQLLIVVHALPLEKVSSAAATCDLQ